MTEVRVVGTDGDGGGEVWGVIGRLLEYGIFLV